MQRPLFLSLALLAVPAPALAQGWVAEFLPPQSSQEVNVSARSLELSSGGDLLVGGQANYAGSARGYRASFGFDGTKSAAWQHPCLTGRNASFYDIASGWNTVAACGVTESNTGALQPWMGLFNGSTGATIWELTPAVESGRLNAITRVSNGFVAVGDVVRSGGDAMLIVKMTLNGNLLVRTLYDDLQSSDDAFDVIETSDFGVLVAGRTRQNLRLVKFDSLGARQWARMYAGDGQQGPPHLALAPDGDVFVATSLHDTTGVPEQPWVLRVRMDGSVEWQYEYASLRGSTHSITSTPDGGCAVLCTRALLSEDHSTILKLDAAGAAEWERIYTWRQGESTSSGELVAAADGSLFTVQRLVNYVSGAQRSIVARLGANGATPSECDAESFTLPVSRVATSATPSLYIEVAVTPTTAVLQHHLGIDPALSSAAFQCGGPCSGTTSFCAGAPNSAGDGARIDTSGSTSVGLNDFELIATGVPPQKAGMFFYGQGSAFAPLGDGLRCVATPLFRLPVVVSDATGAARCALDLAAPPQASALITPGSTWRFQLWYRDPQGGPAGMNTSDGVAATFCP